MAHVARPRPVAPAARIAAALELLDEAYNRRSWHGTNLRGSVRRLTADEAAWRPTGVPHSVADIVLHCAYWKYAARRRLVGAPRGSFPLQGSNWFGVRGALSDADWHARVALLDKQHAELRAVVAALSPARLDDTPAGSKVPTAMLLRGVALHDVYHAGQIQVIKGMLKRR